jgi:hypothetical protein
MLTSRMQAFKDTNYFSQAGGMKQMGQAIKNGNSLLPDVAQDDVG